MAPSSSYVSFYKKREKNKRKCKIVFLSHLSKTIAWRLKRERKKRWPFHLLVVGTSFLSHVLMAFGGRLHLPSFPKVRRKIPSWSSYTRNTGALKRSRILIRKRRKKRTKIPETKWLDEASFSDSCIPGPLELAQLVMNTRRKRGEMETTPIGRGDDAFLHSYHKVAGRSLASFLRFHLHNRKEYIAHLVGCYVSSLFQGLFFTCVCVCVSFEFRSFESHSHADSPFSCIFSQVFWWLCNLVTQKSPA